MCWQTMIATQGNYLNMKRKRKKEMKSRKHETVQEDTKTRMSCKIYN